MNNSHPPSDNEIKEARYHLWSRGILEWKCDITQQKIYDFFHTNTNKTIVINCSRRLGKTYLLTIMALEQCIKKPKSIVKFLQPEVKMIRTNIRPIMDEILEDCPLDLRPSFKVQENIYFFKNGSEIHLAGTDNGNYEKLRGSNCHLAIIDEAGFCSDLRYIINSILIPTTTLTKGRIILSSTTPPQPDHEFIQYMNYAEQQGNLIKKTIFDAAEDQRNDINPRITEEIIEDIIKSMPAGRDDQAFQTEYECKIIFNSNEAVIPEFTETVQKETITVWSRPPFYNTYTSMDIGFEDLTVVLFGYWDFDNAVLVIEREFIINGPNMTSRTLAENIIEIEEQLWTNRLTGEFLQPKLRVSDNNLILLNDLQREFNLTFLATEKHNKDAYINQLRNMIQNYQIIIHPDCKTLISHLKNATWDKTRKDFKRSSDNGHFDAVMALVYMVRNIDMQSNPYPSGFLLRNNIPRKMMNNDNLSNNMSQMKKIFIKTRKITR